MVTATHVGYFDRHCFCLLCILSATLFLLSPLAHSFGNAAFAFASCAFFRRAMLFLLSPLAFSFGDAAFAFASCAFFRRRRFCFHP
jgi:hypothetical protein